MINETHDPLLRSWIESANDASSDFPIQNLPFGVFRRSGKDEEWRVGVAIGTLIVDVSEALSAGLISADATVAAESCRSPALNALMALGASHWSALRRSLGELLRVDTQSGQRARQRASTLLVSQSDAEMTVPAHVNDYTDFYASVYHATNVGSMFRPDQPLLPNYKWVPIGYHGRASSIVVSGTRVRRPIGQVGSDASTPPVVGPTRRLDYEAEVAFFVGPGNALGTPIPIAEASQHIFGLSLLNDWSARDLQAWEYQPLGPFLAKNFATTLSPWVVTMDAVAPFRTTAFPRPDGDPAPLPYLHDTDDAANGGIDMTIEVSIQSTRMRGEGMPASRVSRSNLRDMYWTPAQLLAHHASNGCNLSPGDVLGSGTISGATKESRGCLLELTWRGSEPLTLASGEERRFLEDGDEVEMRAFCARDGFRRIGFGSCRGEVVPA
ncbi:MAG: fumarylacetoacetase [Gemmatimonadaceae bacterium]